MELFQINDGEYAGIKIRTAPNHLGVLCAHAHDFMKVAKCLKTTASANASWCNFKIQHPGVGKLVYSCQFSRQKCDGLSQEGVEWCLRVLGSGNTFIAKKRKRKEGEYHDFLHSKMGGLCEVKCESGRIDMLNEATKTIIEIKNGKNWIKAVGQLYVYGLEYPDFKKVMIIFNGVRCERRRVVRKCKKLNIHVFFISEKFKLYKV